MAGVDKTLSVKDGFSSVLTKYIDLLDKSIKQTDNLTQAADRMTKTYTIGAEHMKLWDNALNMASMTTGKAVDDIEALRFAMESTFSNGGMTQYADLLEFAVDKVTNVLGDMGYAWANAGTDADRATLIMSKSIDELVASGDLIKVQADVVEETADDWDEYADSLEDVDKKLTQIQDSVEKTSKKLNIHGGLLDGVTRKLIAIGASYLSVRKLIGYFRAAASRAPDEISKKYEKLKENISNLSAGSVVTAMDKATAGVDKLNAALASPAGQKFARAMEVAGRVVGDGLALVFEKFAALVEWMGNNSEQVAMAAGIAFAFLATKLFLTAAAALAAHWPLLALVAGVVLLADVLMKLGITSEQIFGAIGAGIYVLYGIGYNAVADIYNVVATFAEFLANVFNDPFSAIAELFHQLIAMVLDVLKRAADAIDFVFGSNLSATISKWQTGVDSFFNMPNEITIERMANLDYRDLIKNGWDAGKTVGNSLTSFSLENAIAQDVKSISKNTGAIKDALSDEDLKSIVDMAERAFVNQVNLTSQTPIITINGQNTGNTEADRLNLSNTIRDILLDQIATAPSIPSPAYFGV